MYSQKHPNARQEDIAAAYGVERSTVSKILKHKTKWLAISEGEDNQVAKHRCVPVLTYHGLDIIIDYDII